MAPNDSADRLSRLKTFWTKVFRAHQAEGEEAHHARRQLLLRYHGAVYRYLLGTLRDPSAAEDLTQDFAVRFLRGDFKGADPGKGRFRDYLRTAVRHLAHNHWEQQNRARDRGPQPLPEKLEVAAAEEGPGESDPAFVQAWREELLARTWEALAQAQEETGTVWHTLLRLKTEQPELRSAELAALLAPKLGKVLSEEAVRQQLKRARDHFAELLIEEVACSLPQPSPEALEQELLELGLLDYCKSALQRRAGGP